MHSIRAKVGKAVQAAGAAAGLLVLLAFVALLVIPIDSADKQSLPQVLANAQELLVYVNSVFASTGRFPDRLPEALMNGGRRQNPYHKTVYKNGKPGDDPGVVYYSVGNQGRSYEIQANDSRGMGVLKVTCQTN